MNDQMMTSRPLGHNLIETTLGRITKILIVCMLYTVPNPSTAADTADVEGLYEQHCAACHNAGVARAPDPRMMRFLSTTVIHKTLSEGVMRDQAQNLTPDEKIRLAEFLTGRKLTQAKAPALPPMCSSSRQSFNWQLPLSGPNWGLTWGNSREVGEQAASLSRADIPTLELKWAFEFPGAQRARSHPLIAGGAVFTGGQDGTVYALDAETGCVRWTYSAAAEVRTGISYSQKRVGEDIVHRLFFGDILGRVYSLDADTGTQLWRIRADEHPAATITGTPTAYKNRLYVPVSSLEVLSASSVDYECCNFRGSVLALELDTGATLWRSYTVVETLEAQEKNSAGVQNFGPSGAPIWNSPTIDTKRQQLYVGTGENYSSPATGMSDAVLAMALDTGDVRWVYQATINDAWNAACFGQQGGNCPKENGPDFDFGAAAVLITDSTGRDLVLGPQKSGVVHAIDPDTGEKVWQTRLGRGGLHGGVHFGIAVSTDRAFIPISDANDFRSYPTAANPGLFAISVVDGTSLWQSPQSDECQGREFCERGIGGAITATPSLVFAGALDGYLRIHDAKTGAIIRKIDTTQSVKTVNGTQARGGSMDGGTAPLPFGGRLYVNSGYNFAGHMAGNVLLVYGPP